MDCNDHLYIYDGAHATGNFRVSWSSIWLVRKKQVECTSKPMKTKILGVMSISSQLQKRNKTKRAPHPPFPPLPNYTLACCSLSSTSPQCFYLLSYIFSALSQMLQKTFSIESLIFESCAVRITSKHV